MLKSSSLSDKPKTQWDLAIERVLAEMDQPDSKVNLFDLSFPKQTNFIEDPFKRKALFCTRRGAKSYSGGLYLCDTVEKYHGVNTLYLSLTKDSAMGIIWTDILQKIDNNHSLGMHFRESKRDVKSRTGSRIYVSGADADADEMQKLLGKKYKLIIIDEAQAFSVDLRTLVYGILGPTLIDQGGTICLLGTAGNLTAGLFHDVTTGKEPGWKTFEWTAHDNPYVAKQWQEELDDIAANRPLFMETSLFKQWYLNQWVIDEDAKVYKYRAKHNEAPSLPVGMDGFRYVLGLDLAHSPDSTAFVVGAYSESSPNLFLTHAHKATGMDLTDVAKYVAALEKQYPIDVQIVDGANKQAVAELNNRHGMRLIPADKTGKADFIKLMNSDFQQGKIKLLPSTEPLKEEYKKLIWETDGNGKVLEPRKEHPSLHNDACDAALYLWRYCYQYLFKAAESFPDRSKQEVWEPEHIKKLQDQVRKEKNPDELELNWTETWDDDDTI